MSRNEPFLRGTKCLWTETKQLNNSITECDGVDDIHSVVEFHSDVPRILIFNTIQVIARLNITPHKCMRQLSLSKKQNKNQHSGSNRAGLWHVVEWLIYYLNYCGPELWNTRAVLQFNMENDEHGLAYNLLWKKEQCAKLTRMIAILMIRFAAYWKSDA